MTGFCHRCGHFFGTLNTVTAWCLTCTDRWFQEMAERGGVRD
jgi:hypothetical protein